ncbi:hypothetical protein JCM10207_006194 [Rhodosporidiobolus poonsookiae]
MATAPAPAPPKAPRSQFLQKLHSLLENPIDPDGLRWVTDDSFEISSKDSVAIHALSPQFEFHSLSSFIRQLSYYSFRRLSDRRRSTERRASHTGYIVFTHPTGFFVRGDPSKLNQIVRKARNRPEKTGGRRISMCSAASDDFAPALPPPVPQWQPPDFRPQFGSDRQPLPSLQNLPSFVSTFAPPPSRHDPVTQWRNYSPSTSTWLDPNRADPEDRFGLAHRRASLGDFKLNPSMPPYTNGLPSLQEERPRLRKAISSQELPTIGTFAPVPDNQGYPQQQQQQPSPYPTPTFESSAPTYFASHHQPPPPGGASHDYSYPPQHAAPTTTHSHLTYEPVHSLTSPFSAAYQPIAPPPASLAAPAGKIPPSPSHSPLYGAPPAHAHDSAGTGPGSPSPSHSPTAQTLALPPLHHSSGGAQSHFDPRILAPGEYVPASHPHSHHAQPYYAPPAVPLAQEEASPRSAYAPLPGLGARMQQSAYLAQTVPPTMYGHSQVQHDWSPAPLRSAY